MLKKVFLHLWSQHKQKLTSAICFICRANPDVTDNQELR